MRFVRRYYTVFQLLNSWDSSCNNYCMRGAEASRSLSAYAWCLPTVKDVQTTSHGEAFRHESETFDRGNQTRPGRRKAYNTIAIGLWNMTTLQVRNETRLLLDKLKRQMGLRSYDEVIRKLLRARTGLPESLFGACKRSKPFVREGEDEHKL